MHAMPARTDVNGWFDNLHGQRLPCWNLRCSWLSEPSVPTVPLRNVVRLGWVNSLLGLAVCEGKIWSAWLHKPRRCHVFYMHARDVHFLYWPRHLLGIPL